MSVVSSDLGVCLIGDSMGDRGQFFPPELRLLAPHSRVFGRAVPVGGAPGDNLGLHEAVYACDPGGVIVFDGGGDARFGYWGEILTTAALHRRVGGAVVFGGVRDSVAVAEAGFPIVCFGPNPRQAAKKVPGALNVPIEVGSCTVRPGDLVVADDDGALVLQREHVHDVLEAAIARSEWEEQVLREVSSGKTTLDVLGVPRRAPAAQ